MTHTVPHLDAVTEALLHEGVQNVVSPEGVGVHVPEEVAEVDSAHSQGAGEVVRFAHVL